MVGARVPKGVQETLNKACPLHCHSLRRGVAIDRDIEHAVCQAEESRQPDM